MGRVDNTGNKEITMNNNIRNKLKMGAPLLLVVAMLAVGLGQGFVALAAPGGVPASAPQAAIDNPATCTVAAGSVTCNLYATTGTLTLPGGATVDIWGYSDTAGGQAQLPGPTIIATEGDVVTINLTNNLAEDSALIFPGQALIPDLTGAAANGGTQTYIFTASNPGTYLYEAGLLPDAARQVAMGLFGALVVRPLSGANHAYDASSVFVDEALLVLSEIDPDLNANPAGFDMRDFVPQYRLINGKAYPQTADIPTAAGNSVLLRYVNAGIQQHTMGILGMGQELIARDANLRPYPQRELAESIGPGRTADAIVTVPASAGTLGETHFALYDASLLLHNNGAGFGGMLTFLTVTDGTPPATGPTTNLMALSPNPADGSVDVTLSATISGPSTITAAEYFVDATGAEGTGCTMTVGANTGSVSVSATIPAAVGATPPCADLATLAHGDHTVYVHGSDGTWGAFNFATLSLDKLGPATTGITLAPNPSDGSLDVAVSATGNSDITAAEYFIGAPGADGTGTAMTVNVVAPIASLAGTIDAATMAGLAEGAHTVSVHSMDEFGQWGGFAEVTLAVDQTGPDTSNVVADPNPNNGSTPYNPTVFAVRVDATLSDPMSPDVNSTIQRAEGFINTVGADGTGFPLSPSDGLFNEAVEDAYVYIPLSTIGTLGVGTHQIYVHAQDASGNWGATAFVDFVIETDIPTVTGVTVTPNTTDGTVLVALTASASDPSSGIDQAEWFAGPDPGTGNGRGRLGGRLLHHLGAGPRRGRQLEPDCQHRPHRHRGAANSA
jgi:FtsP/CotA-like multicopper oxidase with cupredoxin domain